MNELVKFKNRLKKIGYEINLEGNIPWIYLDSVNGNKVKPEDWINANHGHCIAWYPVRDGEELTLNWQDMELTFKLIRKYGKPIHKYNNGIGATLCHDCGVITTAIAMVNAAKGKRIKPETLISLGKRVGDRKLQIDNRVKSGASDIADASGVRNPQNRARIERDLEAEINVEFENQKTEFKNGKRKTPPNINEARRDVEGKFLNEEEQKKLDRTKSDLRSAYGRGGTSLPKKAVEQNIDLVSIPPSFEPGAAVKVTPNYRRRLVDELAKTKASQGEIDAIVESIVRSQESIETMERRRRAAGGR